MKECKDQLDASMDEIMEQNEEYNHVLRKSTSTIKKCFLLGIVYAFFRVNRVSIYFLYANEFNPSSSQLYLLLYGFPLWNGIAALLYASLCNQYGYDVMLMILTLFQLIGVFLESIASNFWILFCGVMVAQVALNVIILAYIAWMLPLKNSKEYTSYYYTGFALSYLVGPVLSGFVSYYLSNRTIFQINLIIVALTAIYCFVMIWNTQKKVERLQLALNIVPDKTDDEQFPICLHQNKEYNSKWYELPKLTTNHIILLLSAICIQLSVNICEFCLVLYFAPYVIAKLHGTVYEGSLLITVVSFAFITGNILIPVWFKKCNITKVRTILYICIGTLVFLMITTYLYTIFPWLLFFWFNALLVGLGTGVLLMSAEILILIVQPTEYSGKVNGVRGLLLNLMQAFSTLIIAIWWNRDYNGLFYTIIFGWIFGLFACFVMLYADMHKKSDMTSSINQECVALQQANETDNSIE